MLAQGSKLGFAAGSLLAPWGAAECLRLRNPITGRVGDADFVGSGTTYILNPDTGALFKAYPVTERSALSALGPYNLALNFLRSAVLQAAPILLEYANELQAAGFEEEEEPPFPKERFLQWPFAWNVVLLSVTATATQITRLLLEKLVILKAPARVSWKLTKDAYRSAVRKAELPRWHRMQSVTSTLCRAHILAGAADFLVTFSLDTLRISLSDELQDSDEARPVWRVRLTRLFQSPRKELLCQRLAFHLLRTTTCVATGALAVGAMSWLAPTRQWLLLGAGMATETSVASLVVGPALRDWRPQKPLPLHVMGLWVASLGVIAGTVVIPCLELEGGLRVSALHHQVL